MFGLISKKKVLKIIDRRKQKARLMIQITPASYCYDLASWNAKLLELEMLELELLELEKERKRKKPEKVIYTLKEDEPMDDYKVNSNLYIFEGVMEGEIRRK